MKLLFDENLSPRLINLLAGEFPLCTHLETLGMRGITDASIWDYAKKHGFVIVSKDNDFRQRAFVYGAPPQVIWLSIGNAGTRAVAELLRRRDELVDRIYDLVDRYEEAQNDRES